mgnify:CR=1 FL=1
MINRSKWKNQYHLYDSASNFHNKVREIFVNDPFFKQLKCFQEVPVKDLVNTYPNNLDAVDWYIDELNSIIELHGVQHYKIQSFGSTDSVYNQRKNFYNIRNRDNRKKHALLEAGFFYFEIPYTEKTKLSSDYFKQLLFQD